MATTISAATPTAIKPSRGLFAALLPAHSGQAITLSLMAPVTPALAAWFGGGKDGDFPAQLVLVTPFLGIMVGGIAGSIAMKLAGLRSFILLAACLFGMGGFIGLVAPSLPVLLAAALALGVGAIFVLSGLSALTSVVYDGADRSRVVGLQAATAGLCNIVFGLIGAFLAEQFGWRVPFGFFIGFGAVVLTLTLLFVPATPRDEAAPALPMGQIIARTWPLLLVGGVAFMLIVSQATQLPFLMAERGMTSTGLRGVVLTAIAAASMLGSIGYSLIQHRVAESTLVIAVGILGSISWAIFGVWTGDLPTALLAATLAGLCQGAIIPMLFGGAMRAVPGESSGPAIGLLNVAVCVGSFINPVLFSPVRTALGLAGLMFVLAAMTVTLAVIALLWSKDRSGQPHGTAEAVLTES